MHLYRNRRDAGEKLAEMLKGKDLKNPLILALPRGGVPIAALIASQLKADFDVLVVRKIGSPDNREYGIGALTEDLKAFLPGMPRYPQDQVQAIVEEEKRELKRRVKLYRQGKNLPWIENRDVVLVDDGLATGVTATAAARYLKEKGAARVVLAVPVGPPVDNRHLNQYVDEVICPYRPMNFTAVGLWFGDFSEVTDEDVVEIMRQRSSSPSAKN